MRVTMDLLRARAASSNSEPIDISTGKIREWRSIITLIVFVLTSKSFDYVSVDTTRC